MGSGALPWSVFQRANFRHVWICDLIVLTLRLPQQRPRKDTGSSMAADARVAGTSSSWSSFTTSSTHLLRTRLSIFSWACVSPAKSSAFKTCGERDPFRSRSRLTLACSSRSRFRSTAFDAMSTGGVKARKVFSRSASLRADGTQLGRLFLIDRDLRPLPL